MAVKILMVAGEASADMLGARLLKELKGIHAEIECFGVGGTQLKAEGMETLADASSISIVGFDGLIEKALGVWDTFRKLKSEARRRKPDLAILLDLPDFNLTLARALHRMKIPIVYYVSPQVWVWRKYRVRTIRKLIKKMLVLFPFEESFYKDHGVDVEFVGHPMVQTIRRKLPHRSQTEVIRTPKIAILPGSRRTEIRFHHKNLRALVSMLQQKYPHAEFHLPIASTLDTESVMKDFEGLGIQFHKKDAGRVLEECDVAVVASGTASLETALIETPFILFYRVSPFTAWVYKHLIRYRGAVGMPNLLLGKKLVPELLQDEFTADSLFREVTSLIEKESERKAQITGFRRCREVLAANLNANSAAVQVSHFLNSLNPGAQPL